MLSPHVVELKVQEPYKLWLRFDDGITGIVDLSDSAALGGIFAAWSDQDFWRSAHIVAGSGAVAWGDGTEVDACPLSLYLDITGQTFDEAVREAAGPRSSWQHPTTGRPAGRPGRGHPCLGVE